MRLNKQFLTLFMAASLAATPVVSVIPSANVFAVEYYSQTEYTADTFSLANTTAKEHDTYKFNLYQENGSTVKFTGKALSNMPLHYSSETDGDYILKDGKDYKIIGFKKISKNTYYNLYFDLNKDKWTEGIPTDPGYYVVVIEGTGDFKGKTFITTRIADISDLSSYEESLTDHLFLNKSHYHLTLTYYDTETDKIVDRDLVQGKDFKLNGWTTKYSKTKKGKLSTKMIKDVDFYYFKSTGLNEFKNQTLVRKYYVYGGERISSYHICLEPCFDPVTKTFTDRLSNPYVTEGEDYTVSYVPYSEVGDDEVEEGISKYHNWRPGYPSKSGHYVLFVQGKNKYKGYDTLEVNYHKEADLQIADKNTITTDVEFIGSKIIAFCPKETKEYTIKAASTVNITTELFDESHTLLTECNPQHEELLNTEIKYTLEAGKTYYLYISSSTNISGKTPCTVEIDNDYAYGEPKIITKNNCIYSIIKNANKKGANGEVAVVGLKNKSAKTVKVADKVKFDGKTYKVTQVGYNAFNNNKKIRIVKLGKNVKDICTGSFTGCKNLKKLTLAKKIKSIDKKALTRKSGKKLVISVPSKNKKSYTKLIKKAKANNYVIK